MKRFSVLLIVGVLSILSAVPALAITDPDSLLWTSANGYTDSLETGDFLVIASFDIEYAVTPIEIASETYLTTVSFDGTVIQSQNPVIVNDNGYNEGFASFYFTADQASALSLNITGLWQVTLQGSPAIFPSPQSVSTSSFTWYGNLLSNLFITAHVREGAATLEAAWNSDGDSYDLIEGSLLATDGEDYFERVIPNLRQMAPKLFGGSITGASFQEFEETFTQDERAARRSVLDGTTLDANFNAIEAEWEVPWEISAALFFYTLVTGLAILYMRTPRSKVEFVFMIFFLATPFGAWIGLVDMVFAAIVAFGSVGAIVYFVSWRGAN